MMADFPGARWWKFDLHTHTPASTDYGKGPDQAKLRATTHEEWLLGFMRAGIDCVAATDHNTGAWIDDLKVALRELESHPEYRQLYLFPGVEITANGGVHVLAIFAQEHGAAEISQLLGAVEFKGVRGASDAAADCSVIHVAERIQRAGAIPILAHADGPSGAFEVLNGNTLKPLLDAPGLVAMEICDRTTAKPPIYVEKKLAWAEVLGSDAHHPTGAPGQNYPGSRYTWTKMGTPSLDGLRLALLDGNDFSVLRSDDPNASSDPNHAPENWIASIEIENARYMGNGQSARLEFSPFLNAIVGGRGTGKSTALHFMRAALARVGEIKNMSESSEARSALEKFLQVPRSREEDGGLTSETKIALIYLHEGKRFRVSWMPDGISTVEEEAADGRWTNAGSQEVRERFPVRLFSQGQILELARNPQALMEIVDQSIDDPGWKVRWADELGRFQTLRARAREFREKLTGLDRVRGQIDDVRNKLAKFEETEHASILKDHQKRSRQVREIANQRKEADRIADAMTLVAQDASISDPPEGLFDSDDPADAATIETLATLRESVAAGGSGLLRIAEEIRAASRVFQANIGGGALGEAARLAEERYRAFVEHLQTQGVSDPTLYGSLVQDRQRLETAQKDLVALKGRLVEVEREGSESLERLGKLRRELSALRRQFLKETVDKNPFVKMTVEQYGSDPRAAEHALRSAIGADGDRVDRFRGDILDEDESSGCIADLYQPIPGGDANGIEIEKRISRLKERLESACRGGGGAFGGHFSNFLEREHKNRPELLDRLLTWFPDDGLRVEFSRTGDGRDFQPISQGSAGQRAAALLAFFLAYGEEPIVLDQPEDDLDNYLIYSLVVQQLRESKRRRQIITVTHNPNIVVNGDAEMVYALDFEKGQCRVTTSGSLQERDVREEVCRVMEGGREAFKRRYRRLADRGQDV